MTHLLSSEELFASAPWRVTRDTAAIPDGRTITALRLHRCDSVHVIAIPQPGHILLLREFRPFLGKYQWMLPSGKADKELDMHEAAQRELREETGRAARQLTPFCTFFLTDTLTVRNHVFVAEDLYDSPLPQDDNELIEAHAVPLDEAIEKVLSANPIHALTAAALLRYAREPSTSTPPNKRAR
jgi:ADP-ribose diphosphatase